MLSSIIVSAVCFHAHLDQWIKPSIVLSRGEEYVKNLDFVKVNEPGSRLNFAINAESVEKGGFLVVSSSKTPILVHDSVLGIDRLKSKKAELESLIGQSKESLLLDFDQLDAETQARFLDGVPSDLKSALQKNEGFHVTLEQQLTLEVEVNGQYFEVAVNSSKVAPRGYSSERYNRKLKERTVPQETLSKDPLGQSGEAGEFTTYTIDHSLTSGEKAALVKEAMEALTVLCAELEQEIAHLEADVMKACAQMSGVDLAPLTSAAFAGLDDFSKETSEFLKGNGFELARGAGALPDELRNSAAFWKSAKIRNVSVGAVYVLRIPTGELSAQGLPAGARVSTFSTTTVPIK